MDKTKEPKQDRQNQSLNRIDKTKDPKQDRQNQRV
jgi:hypothetical protein